VHNVKRRSKHCDNHNCLMASWSLLSAGKRPQTNLELLCELSYCSAYALMQSQSFLTPLSYLTILDAFPILSIHVASCRTPSAVSRDQKPAHLHTTLTNLDSSKFVSSNPYHPVASLNVAKRGQICPRLNHRRWDRGRFLLWRFSVSSVVEAYCIAIDSDSMLL
jgi:hypothetical protein